MNNNAKKILIIEDEKSLSRALELKLTHDGFFVKTLPNGEGFLDILKSDNFSLLICDLIMPKMDGFEILETIKKNGIKIPIIILTNLSQPEDEKRAKDLGASYFFIKSDTQLVYIVDRAKSLIN